ncbi:hypothetical protein FE633_45925 [Streptomyces montanus]|uniref:Uncharacterized protein n=1 Tax=Streptomyces montanus TaxID=2580423 RepID=A0A5R9F798_9ACTN|nr:hypothetical protein FE633_45925 [Streptomyces montanus]
MSRRRTRCDGFVGQVLYKGRSRTHRHRLWCPDVPWEKLTADENTRTAESRREHHHVCRTRPSAI